MNGNTSLTNLTVVIYPTCIYGSTGSTYLTMEEMRSYLTSLKEIESVTGIRYIKLHVTAKMIIGIREASGKEFTINLDDLFRAYNECLRFTSPEVKKYIFMGHSPAVALLRRLQNRQPFDSESFHEEEKN